MVYLSASFTNSVSGLEKKVLAEAEKAGLDPQVYLKNYIQNVFKDMDRNNNGKIEFEELLKPKEHIVTDFLRLVSTQTLHELKRNLNPKKHKPVSVEDSSEGELSSESAESAEEESSSEETASGDKPPRRKNSNKNKRASKQVSKPKPKPEPQEADDDDEVVDEDDRHRSRPTKPAAEVKKTGRSALTESGLLTLREKMVDAAKEVLGVEAYEAQALLNHFKWDREKLFTEYFDKAEEIHKEIGIEPPRPAKLDSLRASSKNANKGQVAKTDGDVAKGTLECSICYDDANDWTELPSCHHKFCDSCWSGNLAVQVKDGHSIEIHCMEKGCAQLVPDFLVRKLVAPDLYQKYARFVSKRFVENNKQIKWCPAPNCGRAIIEPTYEGDHLIGICECGKTFCWKCGEDAHTPITCEMLPKWFEACKKDLGTVKWIAENTKPCPKCKSQIEKNDGCFMMTCSQCHFQFCWLCLQDWSTHGDHFRCAKYGDSTPQNSAEWREGGPSIEGLLGSDDYFTWYNRWTEYERSLSLEKDHWSDTLQKIKRVKQHNEGIDPTFLVDAHEQLQLSRRILKYMSAMLCLTKDRVQKDLLIQYHGQLEVLTEKLAQRSEKQEDIEKMKAAEIRELVKISRKCVSNLIGSDD
jgi:ariadne-1